MRFVAIALLMALTTTAAAAAPIRIDFTGTVDSVANTDLFALGDIYTGFAVIEDTTGIGSYELSINGMTIANPGALFFPTANNSSLLSMRRITTVPSIGDYAPEEFMMWFTGPDGSFSSTPYDLSAITGGRFNARWRHTSYVSEELMNLRFHGVMTSVRLSSVDVPEPSTFGLFGIAGLGLLFASRSRYRKATGSAAGANLATT